MLHYVPHLPANSVCTLVQIKKVQQGFRGVVQNNADDSVEVVGHNYDQLL